jgi:hypothetical protein
VRLPARETVFDYYLDLKQAKFDTWKTSPIFKSIEFDSRSQSMAEVTVPTPETASLSYWMNVLVKSNFAVLLAGPAGTGKTQLINGLLREFNPEERMYCTNNMNFYTNAAALQVRPPSSPPMRLITDSHRLSTCADGSRGQPGQADGRDVRAPWVGVDDLLC